VVDRTKEKEVQPMNDSIIDLLRIFALRHYPQRVVDFLDARTVFSGDHIAALTQALTDEDDEVRLLAVEVFYAMGNEAELALPALIDTLDDPDRIVRVAAVAPVAAFGSRAIAATPILMSWLSRDDEFSRVAAAAAIIRIDPGRVDGVLPVLIHGLGSDDFGIRCHAAWHLGQLGSVAKEALPQLKRIRGGESTLDRLASEAIKSITCDRLC